MSTALTIDASNLRILKPQVAAALLVAKNQDSQDFANAVPITAGSGAPTHNARVVNELYLRTDATTGFQALYRAADTAGTWETATSNAASVATTAGTLGPTDGTAETTLQSYAIPANALKAGTVLRVVTSVRCTAETGATTFTAKLKLGSTALVTVGPINLSSGDYLRFDYEIVSRAAPSATSALVVSGICTGLAAGAASATTTVLAPANYATNGSLTLALTGQMSASDANAVASDNFIVYLNG